MPKKHFTIDDLYVVRTKRGLHLYPKNEVPKQHQETAESLNVHMGGVRQDLLDLIITQKKEIQSQSLKIADLQKFSFGKQARYRNDEDPDSKDYIDHAYETLTFERFIGAVEFTIGKYFSRFGKKDGIAQEAKKIADYAVRFYEKVLLENEKRSNDGNQN